MRWMIPLLCVALRAQPEAAKVTLEDQQLLGASALIGLSFTAEERALMLAELSRQLGQYEALRGVTLENHVAPALVFNPLLAGMKPVTDGPAPDFALPGHVTMPDDEEDLAFLPISSLAVLIRRRQISCVELSRLYLKRLKRYDAKLLCVISFTEDSALARAAALDGELAAGRYRGPLHGIPYGAKDLLAVPGTPTTWGAMPYKDQQLEATATVVERLDRAGAVLVAKLTLGALAMGDEWFAGKTRSPYHLEKGSSGSSAGSAAATAAGLVPFAIGSETWGSIVSPATRCGITGLRPTFGRVSRHGAMALSWSMDKLGPICRDVRDGAIVLAAIQGEDGKDWSVQNAAFSYTHGSDHKGEKIGYPAQSFQQGSQQDRATLKVLAAMGFELVPITLPELPVEALSVILLAEAGAAFDELSRSGRDDLLRMQGKDDWPNTFRTAQMIPAVAYIQANRIRTRYMQALAETMATVELFVAPSFAGNHLLATNLTGHPAVVLPNGLDEKGQPTSITFTGQLFGEAALLEIAGAYQDHTGFHKVRPQAYKN